MDSRALLDTSPSVIVTGLSADRAVELRRALESAGATAEIRHQALDQGHMSARTAIIRPARPARPPARDQGPHPWPAVGLDPDAHLRRRTMWRSTAAGTTDRRPQPERSARLQLEVPGRTGRIVDDGRSGFEPLTGVEITHPVSRRRSGSPIDDGDRISAASVCTAGQTSTGDPIVRSRWSPDRLGAACGCRRARSRLPIR